MYTATPGNTLSVKYSAENATAKYFTDNVNVMSMTNFKETINNVRD